MKLSEYSEWKHHPVTIEVMEYLNCKREALKEELAAGIYARNTADTMEASMMLYADIVGRCEQLYQIINLELTDISESHLSQQETENE